MQEVKQRPGGMYILHLIKQLLRTASTFQQQKEIQVIIPRVVYTTFYKYLLKPFEMKC